MTDGRNMIVFEAGYSKKYYIWFSNIGLPDRFSDLVVQGDNRAMPNSAHGAMRCWMHFTSLSYLPGPHSLFLWIWVISYTVLSLNIIIVFWPSLWESKFPLSCQFAKIFLNQQWAFYQFFYIFCWSLYSFL